MNKSHRQHARRKWIHAGLVVTSLFGYLIWGQNQSSFLFSIEAKIVMNMMSHPEDLLHPAIGMPLTGQLALIFTLLQREPGPIFSWIGFGLLSTISLLVLGIGILEGAVEILLSVLPYWVFASLFIRTWAFRHKSHRHQGPKSDLL